MTLDLPRYRQQFAHLADQGVFIGTSSWKYPGWRRLVYDEHRYLTRSKFSKAKFNKTCLVEYPETFRTVCVDAGCYQCLEDSGAAATGQVVREVSSVIHSLFPPRQPNVSRNRDRRTRSFLGNGVSRRA